MARIESLERERRNAHVIHFTRFKPVTSPAPFFSCTYCNKSQWRNSPLCCDSASDRSCVKFVDVHFVCYHGHIPLSIGGPFNYVGICTFEYTHWHIWIHPSQVFWSLCIAWDSNSEPARHCFLPKPEKNAGKNQVTWSKQVQLRSWMFIPDYQKFIKKNKPKHIYFDVLTKNFTEKNYFNVAMFPFW